MAVTRLVSLDDAEALAGLYRANQVSDRKAVLHAYLAWVGHAA